ncbi:MAG: type I glyceraldehyde-3-phosphate dehydrogenase [Rhodobacteraceae bacterium]|nr:type I glyceraldehyde-3-phosphate dehydrogenase [Paracoccaceae bacterium]
MTIKIGINGFGRIGRNILRAIVESERQDMEVVAVNDLASVDRLALLFEFDSVHGRFSGSVETLGNKLIVNGNPIDVTAEKEPANLPWNGVDVALECTGRFRTRSEAEAHLVNGARKVLISAPASGVDCTVVYGVNHSILKASDQIVSNASCTTNCLAPLAKVLNDGIGIRRGFMTTIHAYTGDQPVLDSIHKDSYRARAAGVSMIPTSTGAARAVGLVLPELAGKLDGVALRVPTQNVSVVDLSFESARATTPEEINDAVRAAAHGPMRNVLGYTDKPNVSIDFNHDSRSSIFHTDQTRVMDDSFCRVLSWYDNEWGFSNRMTDVAAIMGGELAD